MSEDDGSLVRGAITVRDVALFTDLYEITMAAVYHARAMCGRATFSLFTRTLPVDRGFLVAAGLEDVIRYLETFSFSSSAIDYLASLRRFDPSFLDFLCGARFTGDVRALPEGTVVFADEPLLEVSAPIIEAQLVETAVLNVMHVQTVLASKAARVVVAARGRDVVEFGLRRTQGVDTGLAAARCAAIAGASATSDVLAARWYGLQPTGTMAHSFVEAFSSEIEAFRAFADVFPDSTTLLLDTYDTVAAAHKAVVVAREMVARGSRLAAVRLDSGDLLELSRAVRGILDDADLRDVKIFASGGLDEFEVERLVSAGAPIDAFGVGTKMTTSSDAPNLDMAYKLVRYEGRDVLKLSPGKVTWPGERQVYRRADADGTFVEDVVCVRGEAPPADGVALLDEVMRGGQASSAPEALGDVRSRCVRQVSALPPGVRRLHAPASFPVRFSRRLTDARRAAIAAVTRREHLLEPDAASLPVERIRAGRSRPP
ncbi:MAG TPA: nicotinate phosphoribosyltransferase [Gemmatimonadaceae bacterium]